MAENKVEPAPIPSDEAYGSAPWMAGVKPVPLFQKFLQEIAPKIYLRKISFSVLEAFVNVDVTAEKIGFYLAQNPYFEDLFLRVIRALGRENIPSINAAVVLLGMQRS